MGLERSHSVLSSTKGLSCQVFRGFNKKSKRVPKKSKNKHFLSLKLPFVRSGVNQNKSLSYLVTRQLLPYQIW